MPQKTTQIHGKSGLRNKDAIEDQEGREFIINWKSLMAEL